MERTTRPPAPRGGGRSLSERARERMERSFAADFSSVRIHEDGTADEAGVLAYARGDDVHARSGVLDDSERGLALLGHELAHVVQQRQGRAGPAAAGGAFAIDPGLEAEADDLGRRAARGEVVATQATGGRASGDAPAQPAIGFELELRVIVSEHRPIAPTSTVTADELRTRPHATSGEEVWVDGTNRWTWDPACTKNVNTAYDKYLRPDDVADHQPGRWVYAAQTGSRAKPGTADHDYFDPGSSKAPFYRDATQGVDAVVDHASSVSSFMNDGKHGRYASIVELVTAHKDEFAADDVFFGPIRAAAALAGSIQDQVIETGKRKSAQSVLGSALRPLFLGIDLGDAEGQWQSTTANAQATFGVRLDHVADMMKTRGPSSGQDRTSKIYNATLGAMSSLANDLAGLNISPKDTPSLWGYLHFVCLYLIAGTNHENIELDKNVVPLLVRDQFDRVLAAAVPPLEAARLTGVDTTALHGRILSVTHRASSEPLLGDGFGGANVGAWLTAALQGTLDPQFAQWGMARQVPCEQVGPTGQTVAAPVMEEREVKMPQSSGPVPVSGWEAMAAKYRDEMKTHNTPATQPQPQTSSGGLGGGGLLSLATPPPRQNVGTGLPKGTKVYLQDGTEAEIIRHAAAPAGYYVSFGAVKTLKTLAELYDRP